jgi:hypothetical protein
MHKYLLIPAVIVSLFSCNHIPFVSSAHKSLADSLHAADTNLRVIGTERLIVPGKRIGNIYINGNADSLVTLLGKPDFTDAAMGAQLMKWDVIYNKKKYKTNVYSHRGMGGADRTVSQIREIRTTSPWYKTADYAGAGSELKDIKKLYKLKIHPLTAGSKTSLYDARSQGIAFEIDSTGRCSAILIHAPNDSTSTYLDIR